MNEEMRLLNREIDRLNEIKQKREAELLNVIQELAIKERQRYYLGKEIVAQKTKYGF